MPRRLTRRSLLALAPGLLVAPALAPSLSAHTRSGPASARAASQGAGGLQAVLAAAVERGVPGVTVTVDRGGQTLFAGAAGVASLEEQTPLTTAGRFRIYSIAKTFTATVVLQLVDEGVLSLDDTVARWLDDPAVGRIPNTDRITLRHLLTHSSGIYDFADDNDSPFWVDAFLGPNVDWAKLWTIDELLAYADGANHAPYFEPGEGVYYSNTGYLLLGLVVEQATGRPFAQELRDRILIPLALDATSLEAGAVLPDDVVDGYQVVDGEVVNVTTINLSWIWVAGGMVSTTADLARFARAVFAGELLSPASFREMFAFDPRSWGGREFGMGVYRVGSPNGELIGMDGGGAGGTSIMLRLPAADVTVAGLVNISPDDGATVAIVDEAMAWAIAETAGTSTPSGTTKLS